MGVGIEQLDWGRVVRGSTGRADQGQGRLQTWAARRRRPGAAGRPAVDRDKRPQSPTAAAAKAFRRSGAGRGSGRTLVVTAAGGARRIQPHLRRGTGDILDGSRWQPWFAALAKRLERVVVLNRSWESAVTP